MEPKFSKFKTRLEKCIYKQHGTHNSVSLNTQQLYFNIAIITLILNESVIGYISCTHTTIIKETLMNTFTLKAFTFVNPV